MSPPARLRLRTAAVVLAISAFGACAPQPEPPQAPRNIILLIGDGMGLEHVAAGGLYANGRAGSLSFEGFAASATVRTASADSAITDSAAGATAMATGRTVPNGAISMLDGVPLQTILEQKRDAGQATGLVTTTYVTHATPAAFAAHVSSRGSEEEIGLAMFTSLGPDVILGGGGEGHGISPERAEAAGYLVVTNRAELLALRPADASRVSGQFGDGHLPYEYDGTGDLPSLLEMTRAAVGILARNGGGFFVMIEGGRIDHAAHANDLARMVAEVAAFEQAVAWARGWSAADGETLVVVTADHETGGLAVVEGYGPGTVPAATWTTAGHTAADVGIWAMGPGSALLLPFASIENTDVYLLLRGELLPRARPPLT